MEELSGTMYKHVLPKSEVSQSKSRSTYMSYICREEADKQCDGGTGRFEDVLALIDLDVLL